MGDDAEYYLEQQQLEEREREAQRQARLDEDARRNREWEQTAARKKAISPKPKRR